MQRLIPLARNAAFVFTAGFIVHLASERAYWMYTPVWFTEHLLATVEVTLVYTAALGATLWCFARARWQGFHQVVLAGALFGWLVEGVITPVMYQGGPFRLDLPALFVTWHGMVAFVAFFYLPRRLALDGRTRLLAAVASGVGLVWGGWAVTAWLPDSDQVMEWTTDAIWPLRTDPAEFAVFAAVLVLLLALAHVMADRLWPGAEYRPGRGVAVWSGVLLGLFAAATVAAVPWAPVLLGLLAGGVLRLLWRHRRIDGPTPLGALAGRLRARHLLALAPLAVVPIAIYSIAWWLELSEATLEQWRSANIAFQVAFGFASVGWAVWRTLRSPQPVPKPV